MIQVIHSVWPVKLLKDQGLELQEEKQHKPSPSSIAALCIWRWDFPSLLNMTPAVTPESIRASLRVGMGLVLVSVGLGSILHTAARSESFLSHGINSSCPKTSDIIAIFIAFMWNSETNVLVWLSPTQIYSLYLPGLTIGWAFVHWAGEEPTCAQWIIWDWAGGMDKSKCRHNSGINSCFCLAKALKGTEAGIMAAPALRSPKRLQGLLPTSVGKSPLWSQQCGSSAV